MIWTRNCLQLKVSATEWSSWLYGSCSSRGGLFHVLPDICAKKPYSQVIWCLFIIQSFSLVSLLSSRSNIHFLWSLIIFYYWSNQTNYHLSLQNQLTILVPVSKLFMVPCCFQNFTGVFLLIVISYGSHLLISNASNSSSGIFNTSRSLTHKHLTISWLPFWNSANP